MKHHDLSSMVAALSLVVLGASASCAEALGNPRLLSVEDLVEIGFSRSRVVIINEVHDGVKRCVRTRLVGVRIPPRAHAAGVRHLAMEALDSRFAERANRTRQVPPRPRGYLAQEDMRRLIRAALDLGWTLVPYEADTSKAPTYPDAQGIIATNWREQERAKGIELWEELLPRDPRLRGEFWSDLLPYLVGSLMGLIVTAVLVSLIVYWLSRRSQRAATVAFCAVVSLITLGGTAEQDKWMCFLGVLIAASMTSLAVRGFRRTTLCA